MPAFAETSASPTVTADLRGLAETIVRLSDEHGSTPVIVMPRHLSLRTPFFVELAKELGQRLSGSQATEKLDNEANANDKSGVDLERQIRFDWCLTPQRLFASTRAKLAKFQSARLTMHLAQSTGATVEVTASIARPGGQRRDLVVGLCDDALELPPWTTAIRIHS